jgi:putative transposase
MRNSCEGHAVNHKRVGRLMRRGRLHRRHPAAEVAHHRAGGGSRPAPDLVEAGLHRHRPDQLWVADITYVPTAAGFLFLAVVLDAWSRRVVGWAMESHLKTDWCSRRSRWRSSQRRPTNVIHHSDQGTQYTSIAFGLRCKASRSAALDGHRSATAYDNAMCESFFATLECELLDRERFRTQAEATMKIFDFIEGWYNPAPAAFGDRLQARRHSSSDPPPRGRVSAGAELSTRCCCERTLRALRSSAWITLRLRLGFARCNPQ